LERTSCRSLTATRVVAYDFLDMNAAGSVLARRGDLEAYYEANMDLVSVTPEFNLYEEVADPDTRGAGAPGQVRLRAGGAPDGNRHRFDRLPGVIVSGGRVVRSVLSPGVRVNSYCEVESSILMPKVEIGRYSRVRRAIVDTGVKVPENTTIGFDRDADRAAGTT
jgi:glucose-1-phosphate adenylyltransferase